MGNLFSPEGALIAAYCVGLYKFIQLCRNAPVDPERGDEDDDGRG